MEKQKFLENEIINDVSDPVNFHRGFPWTTNPPVGQTFVYNQIEILVDHILYSISLIFHFTQPCD